MTALLNGAESGTADGTTVTAGNSGGGGDNAFDGVTIGGSDALTFDSTQKAHGSHSYKFVPANGAATTFMEWSTSVGAQSRIYGRWYLWGAANPPANNWGIFRSMSGATVCMSFQVTTTGKVRVVNAAGTALATSTNSITLSAWNRIEFDITFSTTVGQYIVKLFSADSTTAVETLTGSSNHNFGAATADTYRLGNPGGANQGSTARTYYLDDFNINTTGLPGPAAVAGSRATETDTGNAGVAAVTPTGTRATETDTGSAGVAVVVGAGSQAPETDTANHGTPAVSLTGTQVSELETTSQGSAVVVSGGAQASETDTGFAGVLAVALPGSQATETDTAFTRPIGEVVDGSRADEFDTATSGSTAVTQTGSQAEVAVTANPGTPKLTIVGTKATETDTPFPGSAAVVVLGQLAEEVDAVFAGVGVLLWPGSRVTETDTASTGTATVVATGTQAVETDTAFTRPIADTNPRHVTYTEPSFAIVHQEPAVTHQDTVELVYQEG